MSEVVKSGIIIIIIIIIIIKEFDRKKCATS